MIEKNIKLGIATNPTTQRIVEKHARTQFVTAWIPCYKGWVINFSKAFK